MRFGFRLIGPLHHRGASLSVRRGFLCSAYFYGSRPRRSARPCLPGCSGMMPRWTSRSASSRGAGCCRSRRRRASAGRGGRRSPWVLPASTTTRSPGFAKVFPVSGRCGWVSGSASSAGWACARRSWSAASINPGWCTRPCGARPWSCVPIGGSCGCGTVCCGKTDAARPCSPRSPTSWVKRGFSSSTPHATSRSTWPRPAR